LATVLIRNDHARIDIAAIDVEQRELPADFFEIAGGHRLAEVGIDDAADYSLIQDGVADYVDVAKHKPRTLAKRRCLRWLRRRRRCQTGGRRRTRLNFRQLLGRSASRLGEDRDHGQLTAALVPLGILNDGLYDLGGGCSKSKQKKNSQCSNREAKTGDDEQSAVSTRSRMLDRVDRPIHPCLLHQGKLGVDKLIPS
jgi:hypothetical protein